MMAFGKPTVLSMYVWSKIPQREPKHNVNIKPYEWIDDHPHHGYIIGMKFISSIFGLS
jgi:hypothetical protein